ncbi:hypothetical protein ACFSUK_31855 [Sphingobium scionense]
MSAIPFQAYLACGRKKLMASAQIGEPPSGSKLDLIRRFLRAAGIQDRLDTGQFLERLTLPGTPLFALAARKGETFGGAQRTADEALKVPMPRAGRLGRKNTKAM